LLVSGKGTGLAEQLVNQGGFTVVNVGNNGNVTNRTSGHEGGLKISKAAFYHRMLRRSILIRLYSA
jgi:Rod binding domain-containing protein